MECPFELPVRKLSQSEKLGIFCVRATNQKAVAEILTSDEADYIVQAINSHRKLELYKEYVESRINECTIPNKWMPLYFNEWDKCVSDLAKELEQALEAEKE